jgi:23S rRNA (cytosine1962-C5)-methyltransferase
MVNGEADGVPGATVDWFDGVAVLSAYEAMEPEAERALVEACREVFSARAVYVKRRPRDGRSAAREKEQLAPETPAAGEALPEHEAMEGGLRFRIRPAQGMGVGLYLDIRETRAWVKANAAGRRVLNCFAYTCAFSAMARAGGARSALNVDLSRRSLEWGAENARLNGQAVDGRDFLAGDVFEWLPRLRKQERRFELVVLDPPSFATSKRQVFAAGRDYPKLVSLASRVLAPGGALVTCCNLEKLSEERFARMVEAGLAGKSFQVAARFGPSPVDFPSAGGKAPGTWLKVLVLDVR